MLFTATFVSGFVALALEVLWTRELAEGSGSRIYLFVGILALFLIGITLGSRRYELRSHPDRDNVQTLATLFAAIGTVAVISVALGSIPSTAVSLGVRAALVLVTVLVATTCMGYSFPLTGRLMTRVASEAGEAVGLLYAANTLGGIFGAVTGGFFLPGVLGTPHSIVILALAEMVTAGALIVTSGIQPRPWRRLAPVAFPTVALAVILATVIDPALARTSTQNAVRGTSYPYSHAEDNISTVDAVGGPQRERSLYVTGVNMTRLTIDTRLMAYIPKATRPRAQRFLVIALGMGSTYRSALIAGMDTLAVELTPSVPAQMKTFFPDAAHFLDNPHGHVLIGDGRNYVRLASAKFDIIAVDPPPPIESAGTVVLYTREFFDESKARLTPAGIMLLWLPLGVSVDDFKMHLRTFRASFKHVRVVAGRILTVPQNAQ